MTSLTLQGQNKTKKHAQINLYNMHLENRSFSFHAETVAKKKPEH